MITKIFEIRKSCKSGKSSLIFLSFAKFSDFLIWTTNCISQKFVFRLCQKLTANHAGDQRSVSIIENFCRAEKLKDMISDQEEIDSLIANSILESTFRGKNIFAFHAFQLAEQNHSECLKRFSEEIIKN